MEHQSLTEKILKVAFAVSKELRVGFLESVYEKALYFSLKEEGLVVEQQKPIEITYKGINVGNFFADLVVQNYVILELKASKTLISEHEAQLPSFLKATRLPFGMLLNFGTPKLQYRRYKNLFLALPSLPSL